MIQNKYHRLAIEYIFITNLFGDISINIIYYKFDRTRTNLTGTNPIIAFFH